MDYIKMREVISVIREYIKNDPESFNLYLEQWDGMLLESEIPVTEYEVLTVLDGLMPGGGNLDIYGE